jgi:hypothetical protein
MKNILHNHYYSKTIYLKFSKYLRQLNYMRTLNKNAQKKHKNIGTAKYIQKTLAHPKILASLKSLADAKNLAHPKSLADAKNLAHPKSLADAKNLMHEKYWRLQKCWHTGKTRRPPMLAQQER